MIVRVKLSRGNNPWNRLREGEEVPEERRGDLVLAPGQPVPERVPDSRALQKVPVEGVNVKPESRIVVHSHPGSLGADRFRFLRMVLRECWNTGKLKRLLVTSPLPNDGKSTIAVNLATTLAERGKRTVLLLEADLHEPSLCRLLGLSNRPGLGDCLEGGLDPLSALRRIEPLGCYFLSAGDPRGNATELLHSQAFSETMHKISPLFDWIVIDAPPVVPVSDVLSLRPQTDGSLLVVRAGSTPEEAIEQSIAILGQKHVMSVVLNGVERLDRLYSKYDKYYSADGAGGVRHKDETDNLGSSYR